MTALSRPAPVTAASPVTISGPAPNDSRGPNVRRLGVRDVSRVAPVFAAAGGHHGSAEVFRDADVACASGIWAAGGQAELHVRPGGFHAFDVFAPHTTLAKETTAARDRWIDRLLA